MNRKTIVALAPLLLATSMSACGSDDGAGGTGGDASTPTNDGGSHPSNGDSGSQPGPGTDGSTPAGDSGTPPPGDDSGTPPPGDDGGTKEAGGGGPTHLKTIFIIVMENHNWSDIKGSSSAPYINGLLKDASYCDQYFDNPKAVHPSEPNYMWLESGDNLGFTTDDDPSASHMQTTTDHLTSQLAGKGVTWKSYQEDLPSGQCGTKSSGGYAAKHNPMVFFTDVSGNPPSNTSATCIQHSRPYTELAGDLTANTVAQYNFITPNLCDDMHNTIGCKTLDAVGNGDAWLATAVPPILASQAYKNGGALFITWDESEGGEFPIGMIVLSPLAKGGGYVGHTKYYHSSFVRTVEDLFGVPPLRDAANQPNLSDLFTAFP